MASFFLSGIYSKHVNLPKNIAATQSRYGFSKSTGEAKKEDKTSQHGTVKYRKLEDLGTRGLFQTNTFSYYREVNIKIYMLRKILTGSFFLYQT